MGCAVTGEARIELDDARSIAPSSAAAVANGFEVHDMNRPQPQVITPGETSTQEQPGTPPSDAIVLFDGKDLSHWKKEQGDAPPDWKVQGDHMEIVPHSGSIVTRRQFADCQLHIEWLEPSASDKTGQARGNSGIFLMGLYEMQVLDNYHNPTYPDGAAGGIYGQYPPLVNAVRPPKKWQAYDIIFHAPKLEGGKVVKPATITALLNGVLVQDHMKLLGPTRHAELASYPANLPATGPLMLQDHGNPIQFRNIWIRELKQQKPAPPVRPEGPGH
jgi:hypothetical protein